MNPPALLPLLRTRLARITLAVLVAGQAACASQSEFQPCKVTRRPCGFHAGTELPDGMTEVPTSIPVAGARATVVEFWAIHCDPCRRSLRALEEYRSELQQGGVQVTRVAVLHRGDPIEPVREAYTSLGVTGSFLMDWGADYARGLKVRSVPATLVLDREGRVRWLAPRDATAWDIAQAALRVGAL